MPSKRESILAALYARLQSLSAPALRGDVLPERIPATGLIILRDGKPGEPEVTLSPLTYFYEHRAELEVVIQAGTGRDGLFDALIERILAGSKRTYAMAAAGKRTLLCDLDPQGASSFYFRMKPSNKLTEAGFFDDVEKFTKAIRGSDYDNLDILPANMNFRDFDVFLSRMRDSRSRLKKALTAVKGDYDVILLDCPPNISTLSENVFRAADAIMVPVVPTTLSQRTFAQLVDFFKENDLPVKKLHGFFSMVQGVKTLHGETISAMTSAYKKCFMKVQIPFASEVERMGVHRAPVMATVPKSAASKAFHALYEEMIKRVADE